MCRWPDLLTAEECQSQSDIALIKSTINSSIKNGNLNLHVKSQDTYFSALVCDIDWCIFIWIYRSRIMLIAQKKNDDVKYGHIFLIALRGLTKKLN